MSEVRNIGKNGFYELLLSCWIKLGMGGEDGMEIMWWDRDAPGGIYTALADRTFILFSYCGD